VNLVELRGAWVNSRRRKEHYRTATRLDPGSSENFTIRSAAPGRGKISTGEDAFRKTARSIYHPGAHNNLDSPERQGRLLEAAAELTGEPSKNKPQQPQAHFNLGAYW